MRTYKKSWLIVMIVFITSIILQGCSLNRRDVKPAGEEKLKRFARKENGDFEVINFEEKTNFGVNSTVLTVKDDDTGIVYDVISSPSGIGGTLDGEYLAYKQGIRSTYRFEYSNYVITQVGEELNNTYGIKVNMSYYNGKNISFNDRFYLSDDASTYNQELETIKEVIHKYDFEGLGFEGLGIAGKYRLYILEGTYPNRETIYYGLYNFAE